MSNAIEKQIQEYLEDEAKKKGCLVFRLTCPGRRGWPDTLIVTRDGVHGWAETKRPRGGKISAHQLAIAFEMKRNNVIHRFISTTEEADQMLRDMRAHD